MEEFLHSRRRSVPPPATSLEEDLSFCRGELTCLLISEETGTPPETSHEDDPSYGDVARGDPPSSGNVGAQGGEETAIIRLEKAADATKITSVGALKFKS
ncbi:hypothetical protein QYF36_011047 [Acer negundo]|nr:hypothetical protein QYF36_011047 [Acer negundo]